MKTQTKIKVMYWVIFFCNCLNYLIVNLPKVVSGKKWKISHLDIILFKIVIILLNMQYSTYVWIPYTSSTVLTCVPYLVAVHYYPCIVAVHLLPLYTCSTLLPLFNCSTPTTPERCYWSLRCPRPEGTERQKSRDILVLQTSNNNVS